MIAWRHQGQAALARGACVGLVVLFASVLSHLPCRAGQPEVTRQTRPPNILFILVDDLGWADVGYHDGPFDTPNIDALASGGLRLEQHYVQPTCSPTRAELLTGRYASRLGLVQPTNRRALAKDEFTLASALKSRGYFTALAGKWHLASNPQWGPSKFGFQQSYGGLAGGVEPYQHSYRGRANWYRNDVPLVEEGHATDLVARQAARWIEEERDQPFFIYLPFTAIHTPIHEPDEYVAPYRERFEDERLRKYGATVTHLDSAVGQILAALERAGKVRDTLVVLTSDNGAPREEHNRPFKGTKGDVSEGSIRVPTIVSWPGQIGTGALASAVAIIDWMPTLAHLTGSALPQDKVLDGIDIWPLLMGAEQPAARRTLYWRSLWGSAVLEVDRDREWKLVVSPGDVVSLYDLASDPTESRDLAVERPERVERLRTLLREKEAREPSPRAEM